MKAKIKILGSTPGYDLAAGDYDAREAYLDGFEKEKFLSLLGDIKNKKILDVGAGTGRLSVRLSKMGASVTALDVSEKMLAKLKSKSNKIESVIGDAESLPFPDNSFDIVVAAFLIVHLKDPRRFFDEAYRVLKEDGVLAVTNINQKEPPEIKTQDGVIKIESYYHRPERVRGLLEELAFGVEREVFVRTGENWVNQILIAKK
ncbi:MAG: class I SAM-dependent methyltransferase [Candidatus Magasanikbacteria bacterium]